MPFDPTAVPAALANRVLGREAWARACLAAHAGRVFVVAAGPVATAMRIGASGAIEVAPRPGGEPDLTLTISPLSVPLLLANPKRWDEFVAVEGDPALATTLKGLAETLPWFVERALAAALGPIVGQRVADAGRRLLALPEYAGRRIGAGLASYAREQTGFAADAAQARSLGDEIAATAARVEAVAARVDALAARVAASSGVAEEPPAEAPPPARRSPRPGRR
jgi:ubiquinone biosynthesis protein UbiJ